MAYFFVLIKGKYFSNANYLLYLHCVLNDNTTFTSSLALLFFISMLVASGFYYRKKAYELEVYIEELER